MPWLLVMAPVAFFGLFGCEEQSSRLHDLADPARVPELALEHATILHQLGIDHDRLAVKAQGRSRRLIGVEPAKVIRDYISVAETFAFETTTQCR